MKCAKCGAEIREGCIYCPVCGYERQIVPDYNLFEEDVLTHILEEDAQNKSHKTEVKSSTGNKNVRNSEPVRHAEQNSHKEHNTSKNVTSKVQEKKKSKMALVVGIVSVGAVIALCIMFGVMSYNNKHSFMYQYNKGLSYEASGDNEMALSYFHKAIELNPDNLDIRFDIADVYLAMGKDDKAVLVLQEVLDLDSDNKNAYKKLIAIYEEKGDTDAVLALYKTAKTDTLLSLFADYEVEAPVVSKKSGTYDEKLSISLTSSDDAKIYYTLDGSSPKEEGELYREPIIFDEEGDYEISAICESDKGIYSDMVTREYTIKYEIPGNPTAIPAEGTFSGEGQMITIQVPTGCNAYYIWNNPEDSTSWGKSEVISRCTMYIEPIPMAPGNNILEVFTVSPKGKVSRSIKCNYIYNP